MADRKRRDWLDELVRVRGLTQAKLADELDVAAETPGRWIRGVQNIYNHHREPLTKSLRITLEELDAKEAAYQRSLPSPGSVSDHDAAATTDNVGTEYASSIPRTLDAVERLGHADMERRNFLKSTLFAVGVSVAPSRDWLIATVDEATASTRRIGSSQVDAIRRTFSVFQELDVMRGGGHARHQLAGYLTSTVTPLLRSNDPSTQTGQALYEAGAEQLYLIGWMAFDDGEHVLAQRYLIQALRLAQEAHSPELGAHVLAGLADQANLTGHPDHALQLARAGRAGLQQGHSPACLADLWALQARAEASLGDGPAVARSVLESERAAEKVQPDEEPEWARFIPGAYLHGEYANAFTDLDQPDEAASFARLSADEAHQQNRARRGSLAHAALARSALADHDLEAATGAATSTLRLAVTVESSRSVDAVDDLRTRLNEHRTSPVVAGFFDLADTLLPSAA